MPTLAKTKAAKRKPATAVAVAVETPASQQDNAAISRSRIKTGTPIPSIGVVPTTSSTTDAGRPNISIVGEGRRYWQKLTRVNPIRNLKPQKLATHLDMFKNGYLREFAMLMDAISTRDDVLSSVIPKRKASIKRHRFQIILNEDIPAGMEEQAEAHKNALYYFYNNLTVGDATDANVNAGWSRLVDNIMDARGHFYSAQEIIWQPSPEGITARFNRVPLWFFENRTGKLRFLTSDFAPFGEELQPRAWLVACGEGLLEASAVAYMFKQLSLKDWVSYNEKHGTPGFHAETTAPLNSDAWNAVKQAVEDISQNFSCVTGVGDKINRLDFSAQGQLPFQPLIQRMDEALMWIWRGGSMGTMGSKTTGPEQHGVGLQEDEEYKLACDDGLFISETLNTQIDPIVIEWNFGVGVKPLAYVKVAPPETTNVDKDIKVFDFLEKKGIVLGKRQLQEHFSIADMDEEDEPAQTAQDIAAQQAEFNARNGMGGFGFNERRRFAANETLSPEVDARLIETGKREVAKMRAQALAPLRERIEAVLDMPNEQAFVVALRKLRADAPAILKDINRDPANAKAINELLVSGFFNGFLSAEAIRY